MSAMILGMAAPALLVVFALLTPGTGAFWLTLAALLALVGAIVERWLFFAEAKHAVMSFYGQR